MRDLPTDLTPQPLVLPASVASEPQAECNRCGAGAKWRNALVQLDGGSTSPIVAGLLPVPESDWNGWAEPLLTAGSARACFEGASLSGMAPVTVTLDPETHALHILFPEASDEPETFPVAHEQDGERFYDFSGFCFLEATR